MYVDIYIYFFAKKDLFNGTIYHLELFSNGFLHIF